MFPITLMLGGSIFSFRQQRYIHKNGRFNTAFQQIPGQWGHFVVDIYTTLVESRWRVILLLFALSYVLTSFLFCLIYWLIAYENGDLGNPENTLCVSNVYTFTGAFLYAMETQFTVGYGFRSMNENCVVAVVVVSIQDLLSCLIDCLIISITIAKMANARKRAWTVGFSKNAVISVWDGGLCLLLRIGDFRRNHILEGSVRAQLVRYTKSPTGEVHLSWQNLGLQSTSITLAVPAMVVHRLQPGSPLYSLSPDCLGQEDFEVVVTFTYIDDSKGVLRQTRTSYRPQEIQWGHRFVDMVRFENGHHHADYSLFHYTTLE
uniref:Uncharacterized protein n=1 Tax=Denticeps clupeoides TaxID=299321 RepID=A0A8C3ZF35_9TELE